MSTAKIANLKSLTNDIPPVIKDLSGREIGQFCTAWISFNGVTPAINSNFNFPTYTDNGTGNYTFDFGVAMSNANYQTSVSLYEWGSNNPTLVGKITITTTDVSVTMFDVGAVAARDSPLVNVAVFGGL